MSLCDIGTHKYNKARIFTLLNRLLYCLCVCVFVGRYIDSKSQIAAACLSRLYAFENSLFKRYIKLCCFLCVHYFYFLMVANNSIRNSSAGNKFTNLKSRRYAKPQILVQPRGRENGWNKDFTQRNPFLSSHFAWVHTHTHNTNINTRSLSLLQSNSEYYIKR